MMFLENYNGCYAMIQDKERNIISRTRIVEHSKKNMLISVEGELKKEQKRDSIFVLIFVDGEVHEYSGKIRKTESYPVTTVIALFNGQLKPEIRSGTRYIVNAHAMIPQLIVGGKPAQMLHPLEVCIVNLSVSGALIQTVPNCFRVGAVLQIQLFMDGIMTTLYGEIVWLKDIDISTANYGCKFVILNL